MIVQLQDALNVGGPALWVIFGISVVLLTVGLWKFWHLIKLGAWNTKQADEILKLWLEKKIGFKVNISDLKKDCMEISKKHFNK